jgi:hypothetical protein
MPTAKAIPTAVKAGTAKVATADKIKATPATMATVPATPAIIFCGVFDFFENKNAIILNTKAYKYINIPETNAGTGCTDF